MHQLTLTKIIEINSNLGGKESSSWFQDRDLNPRLLVNFRF